MECSFDSFSLSIYSPEEVRKLGSFEITHLLSINPDDKKPNPNGLYSPQLGSIEESEPCRQCNLPFMECNGHFGRIEFPKIVFHPILIDYLFNLLKSICFKCHKVCVQQGIAEALLVLGYKDSAENPCNYLKVEELQSTTPFMKLSKCISILRSQKRSNCPVCDAKSIVFKKERKAEFVAHEAQKVSRNANEPAAKKMKMDNEYDDMKVTQLKDYVSKYSQSELYDPLYGKASWVMPDIIREHLRLTWINDWDKLIRFYPMLKNSSFRFPTDMFFMENMLINPPMNRLPIKMHCDIFESLETGNMAKVLDSCKKITKYLSDVESTNKKDKAVLRESVLELQKRLNICYDSKCHRDLKFTQPGLRQLIDKKDGLFRYNLMGKRVNFAFRSVITPNPNLAVDEVGVPIVFLKHLTFPEPMNELNKDFLMQCVSNGPDVYPGARAYQIGNGSTFHIGGNRNGIASMLTAKWQDGQTIIIHRHAGCGDFVIMNRQPTLHRLSMQALRMVPLTDSRVKTVQMSYANCKAFNADFDGDEMNGHYMQSILAQSEVKLIVSACYQHSSPGDGTPLMGLIQDHVIAGTKLCYRNSFLTKFEYLDLVKHGLRCDYKPPMKIVSPSIIHPKKLWTGKDVLSTIIINMVPEGKELPNIICKETNKEALWNVPPSAEMAHEFSLKILDGVVCTGLFDKAHVGPSRKGLLSDFRELYGQESSMNLITALSRMFNRYLVYCGFSVCYKDGFLNKDGEETRNSIMDVVKHVGFNAAIKSFHVSPKSMVYNDSLISKLEKAKFDKSDEYKDKMTEMDNLFRMWNSKYSQKLDSLSRKNMMMKFPDNNFTFMVETGAKGGMSNIQKIAVGLGSIEVEGRRCPYTISGRTLPSFVKYDTDPVSRGFCRNRYTYGLTPQEIFFDAMAGRDGLVDTAVKTSSSGYLQRCIIKHVEDIVVLPDGTVRDNMENVVQFKYGYDGLDVVKSNVISDSKFMDIFVRNMKLYENKYLNKCDESFLKTNSLNQNMMKKMNEVVKNLKSENISLSKDKKETFYKILQLVREASRCDNGEPAGLIAAHSIGEPSTQMTLNTFHSAGKTEMNVTLGIPRLREILLTSSENIKTPSMTVPLLNTDHARKNIPKIIREFSVLRVKDVLQLPLKVLSANGYSIHFRLRKYSKYSSLTNKSVDDVVEYFEKIFFRSLNTELSKIEKMKKPEMFEESGKDVDDYGVSNRRCDEEKDFVEENEDKEKNKDDDSDSDLSDLSDLSDKEAIEEFNEDDEESTDTNESDNEKSENSDQMSDGDVENAMAQERMASFQKRWRSVLEISPKFFRDYKIKTSRNGISSELILTLSNSSSDLSYSLLSLISSSVVSCKKGITKVHYFEHQGEFAVEGFNVAELFKYDMIFDLNKFYTNSIIKMYKLYGIEAAVRCIERELESVFSAYKITISKRHMRLFADYLTSPGYVQAFNRMSMKNHSSNLQRVTNETALASLVDMIVHGSVDMIKSPSANIIFGQPTSHMGTNSFGLFYDKKCI